MEKSSKTGQEKKGMVSTFKCFLTAIAKFNFSKGDLSLPYVSTQIWDFLNISSFSKILSLKSFGNSYTKFPILDITFPFTYS